MMRFFLPLILLSLLPLFVFSAESLKAEHVRVSIVAPQQFSSEKSNFGIRYEIEPHWHIYWKNPGDSGTAPKFNFSVQGADWQGPLWPAPKRLPVGDLVNLGYEKKVILPFNILPQKDSKQIELQAKLEWLVCNPQECLPGFGTLTFHRPVGGEEKWSASEKKEIQEFAEKIPLSAELAPWKLADIQQHGEELTLSFSGSGSGENLDFFPTDGESIRPQTPTKSQLSGNIVFKLKAQPGVNSIEKTGWILAENGKSWEWSDVPVAASAKPVQLWNSSGLLLLFFFSFLGGIILNFMPCVLPVLSIKFLSMSQSRPADRMRDSVLYMAGVLLTFTVLGGIFIALRSAGASIGWGFQLQSPPVVLVLIVLFWLMALNFLGIFEFGTSIMNTAGKSSHTGSFMTGVLSVFIAAPCTGPFMGTALGAAATLPALESLAIFFFLGLGLASPFVLIAASPRAQRLLPRPGAWMEKLKQFFAFPLFATVVWLLWVLHLQVGVDSLPMSLGLLLLLSFALWWGRHFRRLRWLFWVLSVLMGIYLGVDFYQRAHLTSSITQTEGDWQTFSPELVATARAEGRPVFIDFTAAWCITCQFNKRTVLKTTAVERLMKEKNVALFVADWTKQDPLITAALAQWGRNSVPVYAFYPAGASEAKILPQILTNSIIENLFK